MFVGRGPQEVKWMKFILVLGVIWGVTMPFIMNSFQPKRTPSSKIDTIEAAKEELKRDLAENEADYHCRVNLLLISFIVFGVPMMAASVHLQGLRKKHL